MERKTDGEKDRWKERQRHMQIYKRDTDEQKKKQVEDEHRETDRQTDRLSILAMEQRTMHS